MKHHLKQQKKDDADRELLTLWRDVAFVVSVDVPLQRDKVLRGLSLELFGEGV